MAKNDEPIAEQGVLKPFEPSKQQFIEETSKQFGPEKKKGILDEPTEQQREQQYKQIESTQVTESTNQKPALKTTQNEVDNIVNKYDKAKTVIFTPNPESNFEKTNGEQYELLYDNLSNSASKVDSIHTAYKKQLLDLGTTFELDPVKDDGSMLIHFNPQTENEARKLINDNKGILESSYLEYENAFANFNEFRTKYSDMFLDEETQSKVALERDFGTEYGKAEISRIDNLMAAELLGIGVRNKLKSFDPNQYPDEYAIGYGGDEQVITNQDPTNLARIDLETSKEALLDIIKGSSKKHDVEALNLVGTVESMWRGFYDGTAGLIGEVQFMFDRTGNPNSTKWSELGKKTFKIKDKDVHNLYLQAKNNQNILLYDNEFTKFVNESAEQTGQVGAFVLSMMLTGGFANAGKLALASGKLAETMTAGKFLKTALTPGTFKTVGLGGVYGKNALAGMIQTLPNYWNASIDDLEKIPAEQRDWTDYLLAYGLPIAKSAMEGMSETVGAHFLGPLVGKGFKVGQDYVDNFLNSAVKKGMLSGKYTLKAINNFVTQQAFANNVGEVFEERINDVIDYGKYAATSMKGEGQYTDRNGNEVTNFGDFLKDQAYKSAYEFAMFSAGSLFYGNILGHSIGAPNTALSLYNKHTENSFNKYLAEKYPELAKHAPKFFETLRKENFFAKDVKEAFDNNYEKALNNAINIAYTVKGNGTKKQEDKIAKITESNLLGQDNKERVLAVAKSVGLDGNVLRELSKIDNSISEDTKNKNLKQTQQNYTKALELIKNGTDERLTSIREQVALNIKQESLKSGSVLRMQNQGFKFKDVLDFHLGKNNYKIQEVKSISDVEANNGVDFKDLYNKLNQFPLSNVDKEVENYALRSAEGKRIVFYNGDKTTGSAFVNAIGEKTVGDYIYVNVNANLKAGNDPRTAMLHELLHHASENALESDPTAVNKILKIRQEYYDAHHEQFGEIEKSGVFEPGMSDRKAASEFISYMFQNDSFQDYLSSSKELVNSSSTFGKIKNFFAKIMPFISVKDNYTALKQILISAPAKTEMSTTEVTPDGTLQLKSFEDSERERLDKLQQDTFDKLARHDTFNEPLKLEEQADTSNLVDDMMSNIDKSITDINTTMQGQEERKTEQMLEELFSQFEDVNSEIAENIKGLEDAGLKLFDSDDTKGKLYEFVKANPDLKSFKRLIETSISNIESPETQQKIRDFILKKDAEYMDKTNGSNDFMDSLYSSAKNLERYDYLIIKEPYSPNPYKSSLVVEQTNQPFSDAWGKTKNPVQSRLMITELIKSLEEQGIKIKPYLISHFEQTNKNDITKKRSKISEYPITAPRASRVDVFRQRMFREGYIVLPSDKGEHIAIKLDEVFLRNADGGWGNYVVPKYSEESGWLFPKEYAEQITQDPKKRLDGQTPLIFQIMATSDPDFMKALNTKMSDNYLEEGQPNIYGDMSIYDFLTNYSSLMVGKDQSRLNSLALSRKYNALDVGADEHLSYGGVSPFRSPVQAQDGTWFPSDNLFMDIIMNLATVAIHKNVYGRLVQGWQKDGNNDWLKLIKRSSAMGGKATKAIVTDKIINLLGRNTESGNGVWYDNNTKKVMIRTMVLDAGTVPIDVLKEFGGDKGFELGDGATFMTKFALKTWFALNRSPENKQGSVSKSKTITKDGILIKNGQHIIPTYGDRNIKELYSEDKPTNRQESPLAKFMRLNKIGEVHMSSSVKINSSKLVKDEISWEELMNHMKNGTRIEDKYTATRDMSESAWIQDGKSTRNSYGGFLPYLTRTFASARLSYETISSVLNIQKKQIEKFNQQLNLLSENTEIYVDQLVKFAEEHSFKSSTKEAILNAFLTKNKNLKNHNAAFLDEFKDYFVNGRMTSVLRDVFKFKQDMGKYPALTPDMGSYITAYKEQLLYSNQITEAEAELYFTKNGFLKEGYAIVSEDIWEDHKYKKEDEGLLIVIPPAGEQDMKAIKIIGHIEGSSAIVINNRQAQLISGRDYDFDKLLLLKAIDKDFLQLWNETKRKNPEREYLEQKAKFQNLISNADYNYWKNEMKDVINLTKETAVMLNIFGKSPLAKTEINLYNPAVFKKFFGLIEQNFISTVYNVGVAATHFSSANALKLYINYDSSGEPLEITRTSPKGEYRTKTNNVSDVPSFMEIDLTVTDYKMSLMSVLTHQSLDWTTNPDILLYNFGQNEMVKALYQIPDDAAAKMLSKYLMEASKPLQSVFQDSKTETNSLAEMITTFKKALEAINEQGISGQNDSFMAKYIKNLQKIDLKRFKFDNSNGENITFDTKFAAMLKDVVTEYKRTEKTRYNSSNIKSIQAFTSLINRLNFANNLSSDYFNPVHNIRAMFYFGRKIGSHIPGQFIRDILVKKAYTIGDETMFYQLINGAKGTGILFDIAGNHVAVKGSGDSWIFKPKNGELWVKKIHYHNNEITLIEEPIPFTELYAKNKEKMDAFFEGKTEFTEFPGIMSKVEELAINLFSVESERPLKLEKKQFSIDVSHHNILKAIVDYTKSETFQKLNISEQAELFASFFGVYDKVKKEKADKYDYKQGKEEGRPKRITPNTDIDALFYQTIEDEQSYGIVLSNPSRTAEKIKTEIPIRANFESAKDKEEYLNNLKYDSSVIKEEQEDGSIKYYQYKPVKYAGYGNAMNLLTEFSKIDPTSLANQMSQQVLDTMSSLLNTKDDGTQATKPGVLFSMFVEEGEDSKESLETLLKSFKETDAVLDQKDVDAYIADMYNFKATQPPGFSITKHLRNLYNKTHLKHVGYNPLKSMYGLHNPTNRKYEIFGTRNIFLSPSKIFEINVLGQTIKMNSDFFAAILDRFLPLGQGDFFSGGQIMWAHNVQIDYAFQDKETKLSNLFRQILSNAGDLITKNAGLQDLIYEIANETKTGLFENVLFNDKGEVEFNGSKYLIANKEHGFTKDNIRYTYSKNESTNQWEWDSHNMNTGVNKSNLDAGTVETLRGDNSTIGNMEEINRLAKDISESVPNWFHSLYKGKPDEYDQKIIPKLSEQIIATAIGVKYINGVELPNILAQHSNDLLQAATRAYNIPDPVLRADALRKINKHRKTITDIENRYKFTEKDSGVMPKYFADEKWELRAIIDAAVDTEMLKIIDEEGLQGEEITKREKSVRIKVAKEVERRLKKERRTFGSSAQSSSLGSSKNLKGYDTRLMVTQQAISGLFQAARKRTLESYQALNKQYLLQDNQFIQKEAAFDNSVVTQTFAKGTPISWNKLKKGMVVKFVVNPTSAELANRDMKLFFNKLKHKAQKLEDAYGKELEAQIEESGLDIEHSNNEWGGLTNKEIKGILDYYFEDEIKDVDENVKKVIFYQTGYDFELKGEFGMTNDEVAKQIKQAEDNYFKNEDVPLTTKERDEFKRITGFDFETFMLAFTISRQTFIDNYRTENGIEYREDRFGQIESKTEQGITTSLKNTEESDDEIDISKQNKKQEYSNLRVHNFETFGSIYNIKKIGRYLKIKFGIDIFDKFGSSTSDKINVGLKTMIKARDIALLSFMNPVYPIRNKVGSYTSLRAYLGVNVLDEKMTMDEMGDQFKAILSNPDSLKGPKNEQRREFLVYLKNHTATILGNYEEFMGQFSGVLSNVAGNEITNQEVEAQTEWASKLKTDIEELNDYINGKQLNYTPSKISAVWDKIKYLYSAKNLNFPVLMLSKDIEPAFNAIKVEARNRFNSAAVAVFHITEAMDYKYSNAHEKEAIRQYTQMIIMSKMQQINQNTQFQYMPGMFLSHLDSTIAGKWLHQYSHYQNSLEHVVWKRFSNARRQAEMLGIPFSKFLTKGLLFWYGGKELERYTSIINHAGHTFEISYQEDNEARRFARMFGIAFAQGWMRFLSRSLTTMAIAAIGGEALSKVIYGLFIPAYAVSYNSSMINTVINTTKYLIYLSLKKDPPEENEKLSVEYWYNDGFFQKMLRSQGYTNWGSWAKATLGAESEAQYIARQRRSVKGSSSVKDILSDHYFQAKQSEEMYQMFLRDVPLGFGGVGMVGDILSPIADFLTLGAVENVDEFIDHQVAKFLKRTILAVTAIPKTVNKDLVTFPSITSIDRKQDLDKLIAEGEEKGFMFRWQIEKDFEAEYKKKVAENKPGELKKYSNYDEEKRLKDSNPPTVKGQEDKAKKQAEFNKYKENMSGYNKWKDKINKLTK